MTVAWCRISQPETLRQMIGGMTHDISLSVICCYNWARLNTDCKGIASLWWLSGVINPMPFFLSCSWVSISSIKVEQAESPLSSAALRRPRRCWRQSAGASFANSESFWCAISIWIITSLLETLLGSKRWERKQSLIKLQGSGVPNPATYIFTRARSQCRANQKPTSGLHSM